MESENNHHHQLQDKLVGSSFSSLATTPFCYGAGSNTDHHAYWTPNSILNAANGFSSYPNYESILNPREHQGQQVLNNNIQLSSYNYMSAMVPVNWAKPSYSSSQIFPSNQQGLINNPGSLDVDLQALDLLTSSHNQNGLMMRNDFAYSFDHMQQPYYPVLPMYSSNKISATSSNGAAEAKRRSKMEPKALHTVPKKSRLEARASRQPFKGRKEKLGDRIAALQQLVAPFGKTDTASVLMEAIGYIKFLQTQVETLSVPYMKTSHNKISTANKTGPTKNGNEESIKRDLKSRGLCLVHLSCMSYITDGGGAVVWPPPYFGGAS